MWNGPCQYKQAFKSKAEALKAANLRGKACKGMFLNAYKCEECGKFHVGKRIKNKKI